MLANFCSDSNKLRMRHNTTKVRGLKQIDVRKFPGVAWLSVAEVEGETKISGHILRRSGLVLARIGKTDHIHIGQYNAWSRRPDLPIPGIAAVEAVASPVEPPISEGNPS
jgi:hypothetical protein